MDDWAYHGVSVTPEIGLMEKKFLYSDGGSLRAYCGSSPLTKRDPFGLFFTIGDVMGSGAWQAEMRQEYGDQMKEIRKGLKAQLTQLFDDTGYYQMDDALWALNWDRDDSDYSSGASIPSVEPVQGPGDGPAIAGVWHHIATNKNWKAGKRYSVRFKELFDKGKLSLNNKANLLEVSQDIHKGKHTEKYHEYILKRLETAVGSETNEDKVRELLVKELDAIKIWLKKNPTAYTKDHKW
jgi:hypothetical protein